jgi:hypothetical protein
VDEVEPQVVWEEGCGINQLFKSVICFGRAVFLEESVEKKRILLKML